MRDHTHGLWEMTEVGAQAVEERFRAFVVRIEQRLHSIFFAT